MSPNRRTLQPVLVDDRCPSCLSNSSDTASVSCSNSKRNPQREHPAAPCFVICRDFIRRALVRRNRELPGGSESDKFQADPLAFLESTYAPADREGRGAPSRHGSPALLAPPDLAVMYDTHLVRPGVAEFLGDRLGLRPAEVLFNAHVNGDADSDDTHRSVHVFRRARAEPSLSCERPSSST